MAAANCGITGPEPRERTVTSLARPAGDLAPQLAGAAGRGHLPPGGLSLLTAASGSSFLLPVFTDRNIGVTLGQRAAEAEGGMRT